MSIFESREEFFLEGVTPATWPLEVPSACYICLEEFASSSENPIAFTICQHVFGSKCVSQLLGNHCPLCRAVLWEEAPPAHRQDASGFPHASDGSDENDWHEDYDYGYDDDDDDDDDDDGDDDDDDEDDDDDGDYEDYDDYYHDYDNSDYEEGEILDDGDTDMRDAYDYDFNHANTVRILNAPSWPRRHQHYHNHNSTAPIIPTQADTRRYDNVPQAFEQPSPRDVHPCTAFAEDVIDSYGVDAYRMRVPVWVTVRRRPMGWAWRDFMHYCALEGFLMPAHEQADAAWARGGGDEGLAARVLERVEREALPAIEAWNARREGQVWEVRRLRQAWVRVGSGQLSPEAVDMIKLLSGMVLAWRLAREVQVFGELL